MSTGTRPPIEPDYYNSPAYKAAQESARAEAERKAQYTSTARWFRQESEAEFAKNAEAQKPTTPHKEYLDHQIVERATIRKLSSDRESAFATLQRSVPKELGSQFRIGEDTPTIVKVRVVDEATKESREVKLRHLATTILGKMLHIAPDGSKSQINFYIANFTPGNVDPRSMALEQIPPQYDGVQNKTVTFMVGRKLNPDGSLGEVDPRYTTEDGKAIMTRDLSVIQKKIIEIGCNNIAIIQARNEAAARQRATASAAAPAPVTAQFGSQADRDAFRAHQARLRAQEDGRNYSRDQEPDAGRGYGR
ncbi:hypothetical protein [Rhizobium sp. RU36D]|uniref:hypothetical protein n=1 Tax=Rhizobium sp. RU36D TaxID=1907415 RepID=UPI0009D8C9C8|nr:hypothetical protein [Rhizobium sp. RU36D]SMD16350.1 hypothetical protein SAMN05880593_12955 [Rhizobium sp. RU36D]